MFSVSSYFSKSFKIIYFKKIVTTNLVGSNDWYNDKFDVTAVTTKLVVTAVVTKLVSTAVTTKLVVIAITTKLVVSAYF